MIKKEQKNNSEFNTYCIFAEEKQDIREILGLVFKEFLENYQTKDK